MHANEPVARDRLIDDVWGDAAPTTVNAVLNVYLSRLRRVLADGNGEQPLTTQAGGYVLRVPPDGLDAWRFETLLEQGRRRLADGDAEGAAATLRSALALWRGPALADLAYQQFAQREIARLEERRLSALEERIEAELALGQCDSLVPELEARVSEHPYRERLWAQLMLALYRCGRQAEALDAYRRARGVLAGQLGIEPGSRLHDLERAVLRQDASLELPVRAEPDAAGRTDSLGLRWAVAVATALVLVLVLVAAVVVVGWGSPDGAPTPVKLVGNSVAVVDPASNAVLGEIRVGGRPSGIAVGQGAVWVGNRDEKTLVRIDPRTRKVVRRIGLPVRPTDLVVAAGSVWVLGDSPTELLRVDPGVNDVVATIPLRRRNALDPPWSRLAAGGGAVWVCACFMTHGGLSRVDPGANSVSLVREGPIAAIAYATRALWALTGYENNVIEPIGAKANVAQSIRLGRFGETTGAYGAFVAAGDGAVWTAVYSGKTLWKLDLLAGRVTGSVQLGHTPRGVAPGADALWVVSGDGFLLRIDPESQTVDKTIPLGVYPAAGSYPIAVSEGAVWVATTP